MGRKTHLGLVSVRPAGQTGGMSDRVSLTVDRGVAEVRLNRPEKLNALDGAMFQAIVDAGETLKLDKTVRAVVLCGEGRGFCAGLDFGGFQAMAGSDAADRTPRNEQTSTADIGSTDGRITHLGQQAAWVWTEVPVPVIAAIHGVALGGGCQIALGADIRVIAPDARMSVLEIRWGLTPDMSITQTLLRLVGLDVAKELTFTGRMVGGEEAVRLGLATKLADDPIAAAHELAADIAGKSPHAVRAAKALLDGASQLSRAEAFAEERRSIGSLIGSPNQVEAVTAYFEKRDPVFVDP
jgi:enoyl-CoA hydratase/carnithine racemase